MNDEPDENAPHRRPAALKTAMQKTDQAEQVEGAVDKALTQDIKQPYTGHSHATNAVMAAQQLQLREKLADLDTRITELHDERDDVIDALEEVEATRTRLDARVARRRERTGR